jgi:hypothetical protein
MLVGRDEVNLNLVLREMFSKCQRRLVVQSLKGGGISSLAVKFQRCPMGFQIILLGAVCHGDCLDVISGFRV